MTIIMIYCKRETKRISWPCPTRILIRVMAGDYGVGMSQEDFMIKDECIGADAHASQPALVASHTAVPRAIPVSDQLQ